MISDSALYDLWSDSSRRAGQPQCAYPQIDTLREFARAIWEEGCTVGGDCRDESNPYA